MSALAVAPTLFDQRAGGPTLDDLVVEAWAGLLAGARADCPVCAAPLAPEHGTGSCQLSGRCQGCGSTLS